MIEMWYNNFQRASLYNRDPAAGEFQGAVVIRTSGEWIRRWLEIEKDRAMKAKHMSRTLAIEIADKAMIVVNPANHGLRILDLLEKHGFPGVAEPSLDIVGDQKQIVAWLRDSFRSA